MAGVQPYCPADFKALIGEGDHYITHFPIKDGLQDITCLLTASSIVLRDSGRTVKWTKKWMEVHRVFPKEDKQLTISFFNTRKNIKIPNEERVITLETRTQRDLWVIVMNRLCRDVFQMFFESKFIKAPDVYQMHRLCLKYTTKGKRQQVIVVISVNHLSLYEVQGKNSNVPKTMIGTCNFGGITSIVTHSNCDTLVTIVGSSSLLGGTGKIDVHLILRFYIVDDASWFVKELSRIFFIQSKTAPPKASKRLSRVDSISKGIKGGFLG